MGREIKTKKHLLKRLEAFLKEQRTEDDYGGDGYANPQEGDESELYDIIDGIIRLKFKPSWEGVLSFQTKLIDVTKYKPMHFFPIYMSIRGEADGPEEYLKSLKDSLGFAITNVNIAAKELDTIHRLIELEERRLDKAEQK